MTTSPLTNGVALFAGISLAARVELAERSLIEDAAISAARRDPDLPVLVLGIGDGLAVWAGADSPLNKVVGAGMEAALDESVADAELGAVEDAFAARGAPVQFEVSTLAEPRIFERLNRRGYTVVGFENVLGLPLATFRPASMTEGIEVHDIAPGEFDTWLEIDVDASMTPDVEGIASHEVFDREAIEVAVRDLSSTRGFVGSLAHVDGHPAGTGSMRIHDGVAQLCGAATLPVFRRRGVQSALLSTRLIHAAAAGCDLAVVTVQPGSKSQENVQRHGFQLLYARCILTRDDGGR